MSENLPIRPDPDPGLPAAPVGPLTYAADGFGGPDHGANKGADIGRYVSAILRYKWAIVGVVAAGLAVGVFLAQRVRPTYTAQATIWIETASRTSVDDGPIQSEELLESSAWEALLRTYVVLDHVVREQRLYLDYGDPADSVLFGRFGLQERFLPGFYTLKVSEDGHRWELVGEGGMRVDAGASGDSIGRPAGFAWQPPATALQPEREVSFMVSTPRDAAIRLEQALRVTLPERYGNFMTVELPGSNPNRIASTLNALADRYVEVAADLKRAKLDELTAILEEQLALAERNMSEAEMELEAFRVQTITLPSESSSPVTPGLESTRDPAFESFFALRTDREQLRRDQLAIASALEAQASSGETPVERLWPIDAVQQCTVLRQALEDLTEKQAELRALRSRFTDEHAEVRRLSSEVEALETVAVPRLARALLTQLAEAERALTNLIDSASEELREIPPRMIEEARLQRHMDISETLHEEVQSRYEAARLAAVSSVPDVRVLDQAAVPHQPTNPAAKTQMLLMALLGSFGLAIGGALLLDRFDRRVRYPQQVTTEIGLPILGAVQMAPPHDGDQTDQVVEAFRELRLSILHAYGAAGPVVLTVTSPGIGDGKSFVSSNLALAFADLGYRTLLIDGDIRRGTLHNVLGRTRKPGLTDYLAGETTVPKLVQTTEYPNVNFIGAGAWRRSGPELLASPKMRALLADMRSQYQVIIFDSSPLGAGVDPFVLGTVTGNLLMVLRTGATDRELAGAKLGAIARLPIRVLGAVLNAVPARGAYKYYSYISSYQLPPDEVGATEVPV